MLFCRLCAVVTSLATTKACTGCWDCPPIASANWFESLAPTTLKAGGTEGAEGVEIPPPPPPKADAADFAFPVAEVIALIIPAACAAYPISKGMFCGKPTLAVWAVPSATATPLFAAAIEPKAIVF